MSETNSFSSSTALITGGTGSFGSTVLKHLLNKSISEVRVFSRDEKKQDDMRTQLQDHRVKFIIGDVRNFDSLCQALRGVDLVFHAAALKQVPSCEFYPMEAIQTNIIGTSNVLNAANSTSVKRVVLLSTDKAVYPINAMGLSKAMAERVLIADARSQQPNQCVFCATRYGNVMASRGSVIPLFINQIKQGLPLTITDPGMTRFLMSLEDSVELVFYAFENARQGDILVQKSPSATVGDLAQALIELFNSNCSTRIIGTRHGEKLYESLVSREEMARAQDLGKYLLIPPDNRELNYATYFTEGEVSVSTVEDYTSHNCDRLNINQLKDYLLRLDYIQEQLNA